jgi:DNA polymerase III epsilon subunit-like protein
MRVLVFDTETTGIIPSSITKLELMPYIVQCSFLTYDMTSHEIVHSYDNIVRVPNHVEISKKVSSIHGITNTISQEKGVPIADILHEFSEQLQQCDVLVAHNIEFDKKMIEFECKRAQIPSPFTLRESLREICTMKEGTELCNIIATNSRGSYKKWPTLGELYNSLYGAPPREALHNSLVDVIVCLCCFLYMVTDKEISYETLRGQINL